jgi:hypothetical protein
MIRRPLAVLGAVALVLGLVAAAPPSGYAAPPPGSPASAAGAAPAAPAAPRSLEDRIAALPGVATVEEADAPEGYRFFQIEFVQPVDHSKPRGRTFRQRLTLLHRSVRRPMVMYTSGYYVSQSPGRSEPTQIVDGNQLSMEYRFFEPSRPGRADWPKQLTIRQAALDQHRVIRSFQRLYRQNWITTGGSKGGMTATYHRRFFPRDVDATVPYVAPNDVDNRRDVYARFLSRVGTDPQCRQDLIGVQRRILGPDRTWFRNRTRAAARELGESWRILGSVDRAMEVAAMDLYFTFWQYTGQSGCASVPGADATNEEIWDWTPNVVALTGYMDSTLESFAPYYYQAAYQLGWYRTLVGPLRGVLRYGNDPVAAPRLVPPRLRPVRFDRTAMPDVDRWVRTKSTKMLYVYGGVDPWGAEPFRCGQARDARRRQCSVHVVDGGTHGASIAQLPDDERLALTRRIQRWAGLPADDPAVTQVQRTGEPRAEGRIDRADPRRIGLP